MYSLFSYTSSVDMTIDTDVLVTTCIQEHRFQTNNNSFLSVHTKLGITWSPIT